MALNYAKGAQVWAAADAAATNYVISGLGFTPKLIVARALGISNASDGTSTTANQQESAGVCVSTSSRRSVGASDVDAAAASDCGTIVRDDCIICQVSGAGANAGRLDISAIGADGFTFTVDTQGAQNLSVFWEAFGGDDISVAVCGDVTEPAATGNAAVTATGMTAGGTDQCAWFFGSQSTAALNTGAANDAGFCAGFATDASSQVMIANNADDGSATIDTDKIQISGECLGMIPVAGGAAMDARGSFVSWDTDGFTINWLSRNVTGRRYIFAAVKGGQWKAGALTINVQTAANTASVGSLPFQPKGVSVMGLSGAENAANTTASHSVAIFGQASGTAARQAMALRHENGVANVNITQAVEYDQIWVQVDSAGTVNLRLDLDAINSDGFRLIVDTADATGSTVYWIGYLTFGDAPAGNTIPVLMNQYRQRMAA